MHGGLGAVAAMSTPPQAMPHGACPYCEGPLTRKQLKYCSPTCATQARIVVRGTCECGKPLTRAGKTFCSRACAARANSERRVHGDDVRERLRELWATGLSTTKIGRMLGVTKNVIVSLRRRMGLPARESPVKPAGFSQPKPRGVYRAPAVRVRLEPRQVASLGQRPSRAAFVPRIVETVPPYSHFKTCQWPLWGDDERPTGRFCCVGTEPGLPYCEQHCRRAYPAFGRLEAA